jgi:hypothetical protein
MFTLNCACARPRSNCNAVAQSELFPRSWNFSVFIVNILIMHITKSAAQSSGHVIFSAQNSEQVLRVAEEMRRNVGH